MGSLGELLVKLFGKGIQSRWQIMEHASGLKVLAISAMVALIFAAYEGVQLLVDGLTLVVPSSMAIAASWVVPDSADECVTAVISAHLIKAALDFKLKVVAMHADMPKYY